MGGGGGSRRRPAGQFAPFTASLAGNNRLLSVDVDATEFGR